MYSITLTVQETVGAYFVRAWLTCHHDSVTADHVYYSEPRLVDPMDYDSSYGASSILVAVEEWACKAVNDPVSLFPGIDSEH